MLGLLDLGRPVRVHPDTVVNNKLFRHIRLIPILPIYHSGFLRGKKSTRHQHKDRNYARSGSVYSVQSHWPHSNHFFTVGY
jgi:hypothetical protein